MNKVALVLFIFSILIASVSQILLKKGSAKKNIYINIYTLSGYGIMFFSTLLTLFAYKYINLSFGQILQSLSFIFVLILSRIVLKERISKVQIIATIIIIIGIIVYNIGG